MTHPSQAFPLPADFIEHMGDSFESLACRYGVSTRTIRRLVRQTGLDRKPKIFGRSKGPAPEGYAEIARERHAHELEAKYGVSEQVRRRWDREIGYERKRIAPARVEPPKNPRGRPAYMTAPVDRPIVDVSRAGMAADYLRRFGPVYRCNAMGRPVDALIDGKPNRDATHWRCGNAIVTGDDIIERAESKRRREAERRLAA